MENNYRTVGPSFKFKGKIIRRQINSCYWFVWGNREFDIRDIREYFERKRELERDWHYRMNLKSNGCCRAFSATMKELVKMVGEKEFTIILDTIDEKNREPY